MEGQVRESFPRQLRLTHATDYQKVFQKNFRCGNDSITILVQKNDNEKGYPRLGFAIAKKQIKKAVQRNRLKRIFRESFRRNQHRLPARDLVIMVRSNVLLINSEILLISLEKYWNSIIKQCENS